MFTHPELELAAKIADEYLASLDQRAVSDEPDFDALRARLERPLEARGVPGTEVLRQLEADAREGLLHTASGRFFGWVIGGNLPASVAADWLVSSWDQNVAAFACSPSSAILEDITGAWLKDLLRLPAHASFAFVTGCQMAHVTALSAARHHVLAQHGWDVETRGLFGAPPIRVFVAEHHETLLRALRHLGIGTDAVTTVERAADGPMDVDALTEQLRRQPDTPTIVSLAAGELNRGTFDPFGAVCDAAHAAGAWVHVDGAFGLWASVSERFRHLVQGIERADSWATDAHKWLNVPYDSGLAFVAHPESHRASMAIPAAYKIEVEGARDSNEWGPEWSRRARAVPVYVALRTLGREGVVEMIERCCDLAAELVERLSTLPGVEVLARPIVNQGLVRFLASGAGSESSETDHDARTMQVIDRVNASGEAWFGPTTWRGMKVMRISLSNFRVTRADIDRVVAAFEQALAD